MNLPSFSQLEQPISDYHQFIFEVNRMISLPPDQDIDDPGLPLRYRFRNSANENPEIIALDQRIRHITERLDDFLLIPAQDYLPKAEILKAMLNKLTKEMEHGSHLLEYLTQLSAAHNNGNVPDRFLHAGSGMPIKFSGHYRAVCIVQESMTAFSEKLKVTINFLRRHGSMANGASPGLTAAESTNRRNNLLQQPFLTKKEAAEVLGVSEDSIDNYIKKGLLTKKQIPGKRKIAIPTSEVKGMIMD